MGVNEEGLQELGADFGGEIGHDEVEFELGGDVAEAVGEVGTGVLEVV